MILLRKFRITITMSRFCHRIGDSKAPLRILNIGLNLSYADRMFIICPNFARDALRNRVT